MTQYDAPVSLAVLWQRWDEIGTNEAEIERADACDEALFAELDAIEEQIIERPADSPSDLMAKLKFLACLARDNEWSDNRIEKLYRSIEDGFSASQDDCLDERDRLDEAFRGVNGAAECLLLAAESIHDVKDVCAYLHAQLLKHAETGESGVRGDMGQARCSMSEAIDFDILNDLENALINIAGVRECLHAMGQADIVEPEALAYLSNMLASHHKAAHEVFHKLCKQSSVVTGS